MYPQASSPAHQTPPVHQNKRTAPRPTSGWHLKPIISINIKESSDSPCRCSTVSAPPPHTFNYSRRRHLFGRWFNNSSIGVIFSACTRILRGTRSLASICQKPHLSTQLCNTEETTTTTTRPVRGSQLNSFHFHLLIKDDDDECTMATALHLDKLHLSRFT